MSSVNRNALVTALSRSGWTVVGARGFDKPLDRVQETAAAGVIVDLRDIDRAASCQRLTTRQAYPRHSACHETPSQLCNFLQRQHLAAG